MKYGIIGCSRISINHLNAALENGYEIVALCDIREDNIEDLLSKFDLLGNDAIKRYANYQDMLREEPEIDLVAITTPSNLHARMALDCIAAKKALIIEKPLALSIDEAKMIAQKAKEAGVLVSACHQNRYNDAVQILRRAVEAGRFGKLSHGSVQVRWNRGLDYYQLASWRGTWAQDGGCLMNQCVHGIDLLLWMMNSRPTTVYAQTRQRFHDYIEGEDLGVAVVSFESGAVATIEGTTNIFPENLEETLCIFGETGTVKLGGVSANKIEVWNFADSVEGEDDWAGFTEQVENVYGNGHILLYKDMKEALAEGRAPYIDAEAGCMALEVILAMYKSQQTGLPVQLPLEGFATVDMRGEFDTE
ncbi:MAG: Gfo/Idh/MocA family oxidoreductase [Coriobacteriia bacterium]|nr:Gfo/Idh/MocA family oxidoreductase [Coriobacteriia bacterium]